MKKINPAKICRRILFLFIVVVYVFVVDFCLFVSLVVSVGFCCCCCLLLLGGGVGGHRVYIFTYAHCQKHDMLYII